MILSIDMKQTPLNQLTHIIVILLLLLLNNSSPTHLGEHTERDIKKGIEMQ